VYVTSRVSPDSTARAEVKSAAQKRIPEVPDVTLHTKAPAMVAVALMAYDALFALFVIDLPEAVAST
jgi:hypothetical protein